MQSKVSLISYYYTMNTKQNSAIYIFIILILVALIISYNIAKSCDWIYIMRLWKCIYIK